MFARRSFQQIADDIYIISGDGHLQGGPSLLVTAVDLNLATAKKWLTNPPGDLQGSSVVSSSLTTDTLA
ncbi:hypothetical protein PoB_002493300 [Plakobranchus ocellatus]|uniref:Uncharacterized protein n=1 Tax=Plakobranchus ocellatus TaxID=259542 RepID=A0AAV3ZVI5_9GAST|nr:hypothetical protein PoB_002493300 [Plakobranchus ocellatus]